MSYPVLTKNCISCGGLWYNINFVFEILQQIRQKTLQIRHCKKKTALHEATWLSCCFCDLSVLRRACVRLKGICFAFLILQILSLFNNTQFVTLFVISLSQTILEILRYISHVPLLLAHMATKDATIQGYLIPKGSQVCN